MVDKNKSWLEAKTQKINQGDRTIRIFAFYICCMSTKKLPLGTTKQINISIELAWVGFM